MSIFTLHSSVVEDYRDFVRSFFTVADVRARELVRQAKFGEYHTRCFVLEAWDKLPFV